MKYDDASWHSVDDLPGRLPSKAAGTHIAMFVAWAMLHGLGGRLHLDNPSMELMRLRQQSMFL